MADLVRFDLRGIILMPRLLLAVAVLGIAACGQGVTEGVPGPEVAKSSSEPASRSPVPVFIASEPPLEGASRSGEPWPLPPAGEGVIDIVLLGDTNISYRSDPRDAFSEIRDTLLAADIVFANLEGPFAGGTDDPAASDIPGKDWRHSNPDQVEALVAAGFDAVGTANNVTLPRDALMRSLDVLDAAGIEQTGGGATLAAARAPVVLEREGVRVGIMQRSALFEPDGHAATDTLPGIATVAVETTYREDPRRNKPGRPAIIETKLTAASADELRADLQALSAVSDIQIVSFHWGMSDAVKIVGYEREIARLCIDAGADVVFGHGSHRLKPVEVYRGKPIF